VTFWKKWIAEPPPALAIEIAEQGLSVGRPGRPGLEFHDLPLDAVKVNPSQANFLAPELVQSRLNPLRNGSNRLALLLPDFSARVAVMSFDEFPKSEEERVALIKFRLKKSVPFEIDSARISCHVQPARQTGKQEVVAVAVAKPVIDQYEDAMQAVGWQTGLVTISSLAALDLLPDNGVTLMVRLNGRTLTLAVKQDSRLRLFRCLELSELSLTEVEDAIYPTAAYVEDELKSKVDRLVACGFGSTVDSLTANWQQHYPQCTVEPLRARNGQFSVNATNAGLVGYLQHWEAA
jgi:type IV pilus assembly protein PilM